VGAGPALPGPGRDEDPSGAPAGWDDIPSVGSDRWRLLPSSADWPDWTQDEPYLAALAEEDEPGDPDEEEDPDNAPPPGLDDADQPRTHYPPRVAFTAASQPGPPGGYGTWRLVTGAPGQPDLMVAIEPIPTGECDHRHEAGGHDPGVMLRHLAQVRHATCTGPACRRPSARADFEHNTPYQAGGRTCLCNGNPTCRHDHRVKQDPRWKVEQLVGGHVRWTTPSGRQYTTEPTRYPI